MHNNNASTNFMFSFNANSKPKFKSQEIQLEYEESSGSEEQEEKNSAVEETMKELASLKTQIHQSQTSRKIWSRLGSQIKQVVDGSVGTGQQDDENILKMDSNMFEQINEMSGTALNQKLERKPKMKRFN